MSAATEAWAAIDPKVREDVLEVFLRVAGEVDAVARMSFPPGEVVVGRREHFEARAGAMRVAIAVLGEAS
jgi:hypothetical protein